MPKYRLKVKVVEDPQVGVIVVEAEDRHEALEAAQEMWDEDPDAIDWEPADCTKMDYLQLVEAELIPDDLPVDEEGPTPSVN